MACRTNHLASNQEEGEGMNTVCVLCREPGDQTFFRAVETALFSDQSLKVVKRKGGDLTAPYGDDPLVAIIVLGIGLSSDSEAILALRSILQEDTRLILVICFPELDEITADDICESFRGLLIRVHLIDRRHFGQLLAALPAWVNRARPLAS